MKSRTLLFLLAGALPAAAQFTASPASPSPSPAIRDIRPPLDVFPYPLWMVMVATAVALLLLALAICLIVRFVRSRPAPAPPTPRETALTRLREAEAHVETDEPYRFSIRVSDILRQYVAAQYHLRATEQTSPEFLAAVADFTRFTEEEKQLLAVFLERCDLIKFARVEATAADSRALLAQAVQFVQGGAA